MKAQYLSRLIWIVSNALGFGSVLVGCGSADDGDVATMAMSGAGGIVGVAGSVAMPVAGSGATVGGSVASLGGSAQQGGGGATTGGSGTVGGAAPLGGAATAGTGGGSSGTSGGGTSSAGNGGMAGAGGSGPCSSAWDAPATWMSNSKSFPLQTDLDAVWDYQQRDNPTKNKNWIIDQIIANKGALNYCVRVDLKTNPGGSGTVITAEQRAQYQQLLETWLNSWVETWLKGWGCWPYAHVPVKITGWAVQSAGTLSGNVDASQAVYVNTLDNDGVPQCADACYRGAHQDGNFANCPGGADQHFDLSLWLTYGMGLNGFGYDWGQQVDLDVAKYQHILGHEMGHGFGLPDFYSGGANDFFTVETSAEAQALSDAGFIMQAGSAATVTTFDGWMLRQMWNKFERARHGY